MGNLIGGNVRPELFTNRRSSLFRWLTAHLSMVVLLPSAAVAQNRYDSNAKFKISEVLTYTHDTTILFKVPTMPVVQGCPGQYFVIPSATPSEARQQILSRLLTAYSAGEMVNIGYDGNICGPGGYIMVFRVG